MNLLPNVRTLLFQELSERYFQSVSSATKIKKVLSGKGIFTFPLDHCAIIDLPSEHSGIPTLSAIFSALGYIVQGRDYLPEKQNDFLWLAEYESDQKRADQALPQVVVADFRLDEMPDEVKKIIQKYTQQMSPSILHEVQILAGRTYHGDENAAQQLTEKLLHYFSGRNWPLPTIHDFKTVHAFNELLAWVLVFGRVPNHFTVAVHLLPSFASLADFNHFVTDHISLHLNAKGGVIKGARHQGLEQSSTADVPVIIDLQDGTLEIAERFVEFIFRFPKPSIQKPVYWNDYFTGFIATNANRVIESLYHKKDFAQCDK